MAATILAAETAGMRSLVAHLSAVNQPSVAFSKDLHDLKFKFLTFQLSDLCALFTVHLSCPHTRLVYPEELLGEVTKGS